ncbi:MAG TPA: MFS transporter [Ilumatobacteraceae bacterium]|nr:MFS transporter [Ilumatobacteraceae bacterium]
MSALGVGQLVAWGSFYYVFVSLTDPMAEEFGWTKTEIAGALSVALATTGLCSYVRGRWIDRYGGRLLMTCAAFCGAALLLVWAQATALWHLYAISVGIGIVSAMLLYDAAFAVVARMLGADYRRAIIVITLFGGLASTVFVPLTQFLVTSFGWRNALMCLAAIQLPFSGGIPYLLLRGREMAAGDATAPGNPTVVTSIKPALAHPVFWLLALSFVSYAFLFTSLIFNLVPMLRESGYTTAEAVAAYACIGPSQLAGRVAVLTLERFISLTLAGLIGTLFPVLAMIVLMTLDPHSPLVIVFAIAFGTGMGIKTIVQATAAPEFLGRAGYGALQGALMIPVYLAQAVSPFLAAWIWQLDGRYELLQVVLLLMAGISAAAFLLAARLRPGRIVRSPAAAVS